MNKLWFTLIAIFSSFFLYSMGITPERFTLFYASFVFILVAIVIASPGRIYFITKNIIIIYISFCLTIASLDLLMRLFESLLKTSHQPRDNVSVLTPPKKIRSDLPSLAKYISNVSFEDSVYGDLASMILSNELKIKRNYVFKTDTFGFRNGNTAANRQLELIVLGDSFGAGIGTSQEHIFSSVLSNQYGVKTYNLSIHAFSLWDEYMTLALELQRLKVKKGAVVVWAIFSGNDFDDYIRDEMYVPKLNTVDFTGVMLIRFKKFRYQSPLRYRLWSLKARYNKGSRNNVIVKDFLNSKKLFFFNHYVHRAKRSTEEIKSLPGYSKIDNLAAAMKKLAEENDLTVKVILLPTKAEVYSWVLEGTQPWSTPSVPSQFSIVGDTFQKNGIEFYDLKPFLVKKSKELYEESEDLLWWYDDTHLNNKGHEIIAKFIHTNLLPLKKELLIHDTLIKE